MDSTKAKRIQEGLRAALDAAAKGLGVRIISSRMTYSPGGSFSVKFEGGEVGADGSAASREVEAFVRSAHHFGLQPGDLGRTFKAAGATFRVSGLSPRSPKRPVLAVDVTTGKTFKFTSALVAVALKAA